MAAPPLVPGTQVIPNRPPSGKAAVGPVSQTRGSEDWPEGRSPFGNKIKCSLTAVKSEAGAGIPPPPMLHTDGEAGGRAVSSLPGQCGCSARNPNECYTVAHLHQPGTTRRVGTGPCSLHLSPQIKSRKATTSSSPLPAKSNISGVASCGVWRCLGGACAWGCAQLKPP